MGPGWSQRFNPVELFAECTSQKFLYKVASLVLTQSAGRMCFSGAVIPLVSHPTLLITDQAAPSAKK